MNQAQAQTLTHGVEAAPIRGAAVPDSQPVLSGIQESIPAFNLQTGHFASPHSTGVRHEPQDISAGPSHCCKCRHGAGGLTFAKQSSSAENDAVTDLAKATKAELDVEVVATDSKVFDVKVDAIDGKVLSSNLGAADRADKDDREEKD